MIQDNLLLPDGQIQIPKEDSHHGFVTECGKFVRRAPALSIAIKAGQVVVGKTINARYLFSEDLK